MTVVPDLVTLVAEEIANDVEAFNGRVEGAAELAALIEAKRLPQQLPAAFVLPLGEDAEPAEEMTGVQSQRITETVAVILIDRKQGEASGEVGRRKTVPLRDDVRNTLAGAVLDDRYEPLHFVRSRMVGMNFGAVFYQLDFATRWHHRSNNT